MDVRSSSISLVQFRAFNSREITGGSDDQNDKIVREETESQEQLLIDDSFFDDRQETPPVKLQITGVERYAKVSPKIVKGTKKDSKVKTKFNSCEKDNKTYM